MRTGQRGESVNVEEEEEERSYPLVALLPNFITGRVKKGKVTVLN
jgi:hypothetical protein